MPVDFRKPAHVLAVHGVQTSENSEIQSEQQIRRLLVRSLADIHVDREFDVRGYLYEDINDNAVRFYKTLTGALTSSQPLAGKALKTFIDLAGDVVIAAKNTSTAHRIRKGLRQAILDSYRGGHQLVVVAHSLGTVYALDVINALIRDGRYFKGDDRRTWPVQGLVTLGSPLGLGLEFAGVKIFEMRDIASIADARYSLFPWHNYFNRLDPIVSGNIFGSPVAIEGASGPVEQRYGAVVQASNWLLQGHVVGSGQQWLLAHVEYWDNPVIGDRLVDMLWG
jgi:hypothetical protein